MSFGFVDPWHLSLPREGGHVLSFMGSGGKTTLMRTVGSVYREEGLATVLTTTTRCEVLAGIHALTWDELQDSKTETLPQEIFVHGGEIEPGKWRGLSPGQVDQLGALLPERVVLAEIDGAAKKALKLYRPDEPVWPGRTSLVFLVMGVGAVGGRMSDQIHRWGRTEFQPLADLADHTVLEWKHLEELLLAPGGYLDQMPAGLPAVLALGGVAEQDDSIGLFGFVGQAMDRPALPLVMFCSSTGSDVTIRTACADRDEASP